MDLGPGHVCLSAKLRSTREGPMRKQLTGGRGEVTIDLVVSLSAVLSSMQVGPMR